MPYRSARRAKISRATLLSDLAVRPLQAWRSPPARHECPKEFSDARIHHDSQRPLVFRECLRHRARGHPSRIAGLVLDVRGLLSVFVHQGGFELFLAATLFRSIPRLPVVAADAVPAKHPATGQRPSFDLSFPGHSCGKPMVRREPIAAIMRRCVLCVDHLYRARSLRAAGTGAESRRTRGWRTSMRARSLLAGQRDIAASRERRPERLNGERLDGGRGALCV